MKLLLASFCPVFDSCATTTDGKFRNLTQSNKRVASTVWYLQVWMCMFFMWFSLPTSPLQPLILKNWEVRFCVQWPVFVSQFTNYPWFSKRLFGNDYWYCNVAAHPWCDQQPGARMLYVDMRAREQCACGNSYVHPREHTQPVTRTQTHSARHAHTNTLVLYERATT